LSTAVIPFLRWAGGKRWLAPYLAPVITQVLNGRYIEPFLGSGSMFFAVGPQKATLSDLNIELIEIYRQVASHPRLLERRLAAMPVNKRTYYRVRASHPTWKIERAIRFIYLNRTCFGGIHRTNQDGDFNVPYGGGSRTPEVLYRDHLLAKCSQLLSSPGVELIAGDFERRLDLATGGDVIFCDPTYRAAGRGRFDRYGPQVFSWADQIRLARQAVSAQSRGVTVLVMNADEPEVESLYPGALVMRVEKAKAIGNKAKTSAPHREVLFVLDPLARMALWSSLQSKLRLVGLATSDDSMRGAA
jgi:DNA adenine methylase